MAGEPSHVEKLKTAMNAEPKDPVELARLLWETHDDLQSDNKPLFNSEEKELLVAAGLAVLDPALTELLKQLRMTDIAPLLVCSRACDLNAAARALTAGQLEGSLEPAVLAALTAKVETRGAIVDAGAIADSGAWVDNLCQKYPTKRALLQSKWGTLEELMQSDEHVSEADKEAVWTVWSEGHDLRKKVKEFGLPPSVADRIVDSGFQSLEFMKESEMIEIQHGLSDAVKAKLRRMWTRESAEGRTERDSTAQKREALIAKTKDAAALVTALKSDVGTDGEANVSGASQALDAVLASLGLSQWSSNVEKVQDPALLSDSLTQLGNVLERTEAALASETGDHESDEVVISRASGRLALHAVSFGYSASELGKKAPRPLLRTPEYCPLLGPEMSTTMKSTVHNSTEAADNYRQSIRSCGETIAAALKVSGWGFHAEAGHSKGKQEVSKGKTETARLSTSAVNVTYGVVPVKSFQISQEQMKLSNEAENAALAVTTLAEARIFLEDFGSHVPSGTQHLGGIFWKIVEVHAQDEIESQELERALAKETDTSFGLGGGAWNVEAVASGSKRSFDSSGSVSGSVEQKRSYTATTRIECTGPNVSNYDLFSQVLAANNLSWFVIDRGTPKALVPVWDLLSSSAVASDSKSKAIERTGKLLRTAWLENAQQLAFLPEVQDLLYRAQIRERLPLKSLEPEVSSEEQSQYQLSKKVDEVSSIPLDDVNPQVLRNAVEDAFSAMFRFDYRFGTFVVAGYIRDGVFPEFLSGLASKSAAPNVLPALGFLSAVLDTPMKAKLLGADPPVVLDKKLEEVLDDIRSSAIESPDGDTELQIWRAPEVSLSDLPSTVRSIADALTQSAPKDLESLTKRVGSVVSLNLWRTSDTSSLRSQLQDVASKFCCSRDGFSSLPLTVASLNALITEMEQVVQPPVEKKVILPDDAPRFVFDTDETHLDGHPYSYVRVDRPTPDRTQDLPSCILHALTHRLDIHSSLYPPLQQTTSEATEPEKEVAPVRRRRRAAKFRQATQAKQPKAEGVFDAAVHLLLSLDTSARSEVLRLLLERRFLVPFIIPTSSAKDNAPFHCDITSLGLITTAVGHDGEDIVRANLATDTSYMRVAVLSDRAKEESTSKDWIESVFHVESLHTLDCKNNVEIIKTETAAEIGWGFLEKGDGDYVPVILLHVVGDYRPLRRFIASFADAVVLDAGSSGGSCDLNLQHGILVKWRFADPDQESIPESNEDDPVLVESLRCRYTTSVTTITNSLLDEYADWLEELEESKGQNERVPLTSLQPSEIHVHQALRFDFGVIVPKTAFANLRSELQLQLIFARECHEVIALQRDSDLMKQASQKAASAPFQLSRQDLAPDVDGHTVVMLFKDILRHESASSRMITLLDFERWLAVQCEEQGVSARKAYREARDNYNHDRSTSNGEVLVQRLQDWDMKITGMEHLWRELSHLYVVDPVNRGYLATFAAQHLLDGFSLELMDGDAGMMNLTWIQGVLKELHEKLGTARLLVLSVMGVQSSGKSTLLNYMFGVRLRTSVSRCTRGVSIQLLKCEGRDEYEFILLLDTEGIRAPEYIGTDDSVWRDNRMATFAILPADATIILTKGESTITINEILPIVLSAYLESETAQKNGGHLPSKLLFVFNQIDLAEKSKLENVVDTLMRELNENATKVEEIRLGIHLEEGERKTPHRSTSGVFHDLNVDVANEEGSDVRVLGTIKAESQPPRDAPLPDYGRRLLKLREHIHRRVCAEKSWKGRNVGEFREYLTMVWNCIERSNFHLNFVAAYERINYDILVYKVDQCAQQLTSLYCTTFDAISKEIRKDADNSSGPVNDAELLVKYDNRLAEAMIDELKRLDGDVKLILEEERFGKWRTDQLITWTRYKTDQAVHWRRMMDGQVNNIFLYEALVEGYKKKLRDEANRMFRNGGLQHVDQFKQQQKFASLFKKLVSEAKHKHPPFYKEVIRQVNKVFTNARNKDLWWMIKVGNPDPAAMASSIIARLNPPWGDHNQKRKLQSLQSSIMRDVKATLAGVTQYSDGIVFKCIQLTKVALVHAEHQMSVSDTAKQHVFNKVTELIRTDLKAIQKKWDGKNSVAARFETCRAQMQSYFNNLGKGWKGMDLLKASVCDWLKSNLQKSFEEELTAIVGTKLKGKRWVANADVMQAMVDQSLVHDLEAHEIETALKKIAYPKRHIEDVVSQLIYLEVARCKAEKLAAYKEALKDSIHAAARSSLSVEKDLALTFLSMLKSKIREYLHTAATNCLLTTIPTPSDPNFNCDEQSAEIFKPETKDFVCSEMLAAIDNFSGESVDVTQSVLAYIKDRAHGASRGVMPRCGELCPKCKSPCTRELGHVTNEEEKLHDSYHQPVGLVGMHHVNSHELVAGSCSFSANIRTFVHSDGKTYKYSDFDKVFPNWSVPVEKEPLMLREHIFYHHQKDLAILYQMQPCPQIPPTYNHLIGDIKQHIDKLLSQ